MGLTAAFKFNLRRKRWYFLVIIFLEALRWILKGVSEEAIFSNVYQQIARRDGALMGVLTFFQSNPWYLWLILPCGLLVLVLWAYVDTRRHDEWLEAFRNADPAIALKDMALKAAEIAEGIEDEVDKDSMNLTSMILTDKYVTLMKQRLSSNEVAPSLELTVKKVEIGHLLFDNGEPIIQFLISLTLKASPEIQLGKLDLVYDGRPYEPAHGLPTSLVKGTQSYEVEYRVYGDAGRLKILMGVFEAGGATESQLPQVHLRAIAGELDFTEPVRLVSRKAGSQT